MITKLNHATIWVKDQEAALQFYRDKLGFKVITDDSASVPNYRWLTVALPQQTELVIALAAPMDPKDTKLIGLQSGWVLDSNDIQADYNMLKSNGVKVHTEPRHNIWGDDFTFEDLYGNNYDVVQMPKY
jgi:catechol 2,3-dioxygenase-like lactoylglutathione lyase family enzyme